MAVYKNIMMKQIKIKTGKAMILCKELMPEIIEFNVGTIIIDGERYRHIGQPNTLKEEDWRAIVDLHFMDGHRSYRLYRDYRVDKNSAIWLDTATESGMSLLKANGVVMENPYGVSKDYVINNSFAKTYEEKLKEAGLWREAEEQVWVNPHVFIKID